MKNIPFFVALALMAITISILAVAPQKKSVKPAPVAPTGGAASKPAIDKAKRNSIMQRFVSYNEVRDFAHRYSA